MKTIIHKCFSKSASTLKKKVIEHIADDLEVYSVDSDDYNKERIELKLNIRIIFFLKEHFKNASFDGSLLINTYVGS